MPVSYIPFFPDTIEGQAILDNFVRTRRILKYREADVVQTRILRGMPLYETELLEQVNLPETAPETPPNLLLRGECLSACAYLKDKNIKIDLVYIDPPFASGADYAKKIYLRKNPIVAQAIEQAEENIEFDDLKAFEEKMYGDIWNKEDYLNWMYENLMAIKAVMADEALIFVHLDYHIGHYVKILLDEIFGDNNFRNEVITKRITKNLQHQFDSINALPQGHDCIFIYSKNEDTSLDAVMTDNPNFEKKPEGYWKDFWNNADRPTMRYDILGVKPASGQWKWSETKAKEALENSQDFEKSDYESLMKYWEDTGKSKKFLRKSGTGKIEHWIEPMEKKFVDTLWTDISAYANGEKEYATQKSEILLERVIGMSESDDTIIADFFGGSGVTAAVAARLGRRFVHADVGINSIQTARDRLVAQGASFEVREVKDGVTLYRNPQQTMDNLHQFIIGLRNEDPLPSFWEGYITDPKMGKMPVYLPNLLDHTTKVLDVAWMSRIINEAMPDLPEDTRKVIIFYIDIDDETALHSYIAEQNQTLVSIELRDLKPILEQAILPDVVEFTLSENTLTVNKFLSDRLKSSIDSYNAKRQMSILQRAKRVGETNTPDNYPSINISENGLELIEMLALDCTHTDGPWHSDVEIRIDKNSFVIRDGKKTKAFWDGTIASKIQPLRLKIRNIAGDETIFRVKNAH